MAFYDEDAMLFGAVDELHDGRGAIRAYLGKRGPEVRVKSSPMPKVRQINADVAITACHVDFADGDKPDPYRMTWVLVRRGGKLIANDVLVLVKKLGVVDAKVEGRIVIQ